MRNRLVLRNLRQVVTVDPAFGGPLGVVENGAVVCDETIRWIGREADLSELDSSADIVVDGQGGVLTPGLVDSHTHFLYAGSREAEFAQRVCGATFQEINAAGGGILSTVRATRSATHDELLRLGRSRLDTFLEQGITTVEVKSGYGLTTSDEIKMLEVIHELDRVHCLDVVPTFMAAHALPPEYGGRRREYVSLIANEMIPEVARRGLAQFCDVFCDHIAFSPDEAEAILNAALSHGLRPKIHAEQFSLSGGTEVAVKLGACSADHLDHISAGLLRDLATSGVAAVLTPGVNLFLGLDHWPPARSLLDAGVEVALATDYSPGACMTESLPLIMTIACVRMQMRPEEVLRAATLSGARAVGRGDLVGSLAVGKRADAVIWAAPTWEHLVYHFGVNHVQTVIKDGRIALRKEISACLQH